ncbi:MAG TPA: hypothetical protein V6D29_00635 [Leptolyngbyaceae cyanobacterium]
MAPYSNNTGSFYARSASYHQPHSTHAQEQRPVPKPVPTQHKRLPNHPMSRRSRPAQSQGRQQRVQVAPPSRRQTQPLLPKNNKPSGYILAGGSIILALMAVLLPQSAKSPPAQGNACQQQVQPQSMLSRNELTKLLSVPERSSREAVRQVTPEPFCTMASVEVQEGIWAEREAYPLEFDPQTWLVVLYEGNEYAGYDFSFQQ